MAGPKAYGRKNHTERNTIKMEQEAVASYVSTVSDVELGEGLRNTDSSLLTELTLRAELPRLGEELTFAIGRLCAYPRELNNYCLSGKLSLKFWFLPRYKSSETTVARAAQTKETKPVRGWPSMKLARQETPRPIARVLHNSLTLGFRTLICILLFPH